MTTAIALESFVVFLKERSAGRSYYCESIILLQDSNHDQPEQAVDDQPQDEEYKIDCEQIFSKRICTVRNSLSQLSEKTVLP